MGIERTKRDTLDAIFEALDPRLAPKLKAELLGQSKKAPLSPKGSWVLAGHRSAGKSTLVPLISRLLEVQGTDLDAELERRNGRSLRSWLKEDVASFRAAERALFQELAAKQPLIAVGGGFLALHGDLLAEHTPIVIPISFETYRERLLADTSRPRLRPDLSPEEELVVVYNEREQIHARSGALSLLRFLASLYEGAT
jgi:shikimate kinase